MHLTHCIQTSPTHLLQQPQWRTLIYSSNPKISRCYLFFLQTSCIALSLLLENIITKIHTQCIIILQTDYYFICVIIITIIIISLSASRLVFLRADGCEAVAPSLPCHPAVLCVTSIAAVLLFFSAEETWQLPPPSTRPVSPCRTGVSAPGGCILHLFISLFFILVYYYVFLCVGTVAEEAAGLQHPAAPSPH